MQPAMGYNTWDDFRCGGINSSNLMKVADAMIEQHLLDYGYEYLSLDDCWAKSRNNVTEELEPDPQHFPKGMKPVVEVSSSSIFTFKFKRTPFIFFPRKYLHVG